MDFQILDEMQYLYDNEQLSQEEYKNKTKKVFKLMSTIALLDSFLDNEYFDQEVKDFFYENNNLF